MGTAASEEQYFLQESLFVMLHVFTIRTDNCFSMRDRSSHQRCSVKKVVLKNLAKFTGKHLCLRPATLLKRDFGIGVFMWILRNFKNTFFTEHLWTTASGRNCAMSSKIPEHWYKITISKHSRKQKLVQCPQKKTQELLQLISSEHLYN